MRNTKFALISSLSLAALSLLSIAPTASACTVDLGSCGDNGDCTFNGVGSTCDGDCMINGVLSHCGTNGRCLINGVASSCNGNCPLNVVLGRC